MSTRVWLPWYSFVDWAQGTPCGLGLTWAFLLHYYVPLCDIICSHPSHSHLWKYQKEFSNGRLQAACIRNTCTSTCPSKKQDSNNLCRSAACAVSFLLYGLYSFCLYSVAWLSEKGITLKPEAFSWILFKMRGGSGVMEGIRLVYIYTHTCIFKWLRDLTDKN